MAEPLKNHFGVDIPGKIAAMILVAAPTFPADAFVRDALEGYAALDLLPRGWQIAAALHRHLPADYAAAIEILIASLGPKLEKTEGNGMAPFLYLPYVCFVAKFGLDHFEPSMRAQYELTQRFSAEFSIRPYLEKHRDATLARLEEWTRDESPHVRRLVSEGTRPRLPWASRLREFQKDPRPVLKLLELLKDDPDLYVRRSVANNLNDIGKDQPALLVETAHRWLVDAPAERRWLINHALRSAIKRADPATLQVIGVGQQAAVTVDRVQIAPQQVRIGDAVAILLVLTNTLAVRQRVLADLRIHFVKANGKTAPKVFKLKTFELAPHETVQLRKTIGLHEMTTRKHYAGTHRVELVLNGQPSLIGEFALADQRHN